MENNDYPVREPKMSLYSALSSGVPGLAANSTAMAVVADNVTNVNTVGYKGTDARFSPLVPGGGGTRYSAGGVLARPQALLTTQGPPQLSTTEPGQSRKPA